MKKISFLLFFLFTISITTSVYSQTKRYVKTVATGTGDGSSWVNASANLQAMIDASAPNDQVWIAKGTYRPTKNVAYTAGHVALTDARFRSFDLSNGVKLYGGFNGSEVTMGQRNPINKTYLSGDFSGNDVGFANNNENAYHVVFGANKNNGATLDNITITGGNTTGMPQAYTNNDPWYNQITPDGAAIYTIECFINLQNCVLQYNNASHYGGSLYAYDLGGNYYNCLFINNNATDGAVSYGTGIGSSFYSHFVNCTMFNNSSAGVLCKTDILDDTYVYNTIAWGNTITGISTGSYWVYYSDVQNAFASGSHAFDGTVDTNPFFTNSADIDGADNILGTADDGLIPQCGPAIGGGTNSPVTFTKDLKNGTRIVNGNVDMGAYETSLIQPINSLTIYELSNHATTENLPRGYCNGKAALFSSFTGGNGGVFQWTQNGINVGTNSGDLTITSFQNGDQLHLTLTNPPAACGGGGTVIQSNIITLANVSNGIASIPTAISGPANACGYITGPNNGPIVQYKINKAPGAAVYHWYFSGTNTSGASIVSHPYNGVNDTVVNVAFNSAMNGPRTLYASAENWCGVSTVKTLLISIKSPQSVGTITGPADLCPYVPSAANPSGIPVTYSIRKVTDASSYNWIVPVGATINSHSGTGANDTAINVSFNSNFVSGSLTVQAINFCATTSRVLNLSKKSSGTPGTVTGPTAVCTFMQSPSNPSGTPVDYTIRKVLYATSYTWTVPAAATATHPGGTGINDTILRVTYSAGFTGGAITVKSNSNCNTSAARSLAIIYKLPSTPVAITASAATGCPQRRITYLLSAMPSYATSLLWTVPASGTIISGQGTLSLVVEFAGATLSTDSIKVLGINDCGTSIQRKLKVGVLPSCRPAKENEENKLVTKNKTAASLNQEMEITAMPNPSQGEFTLQFNSFDNNPFSLQVMDATGRIIESRSAIRPGQSLMIGNAWKPGIYFAIAIQGTKKKIFRLIKS